MGRVSILSPLASQSLILASVPVKPSGPNCPFVPLVIATNSAEAAYEFVPVMRHFDLLQNAPRAAIPRLLDAIVEDSGMASRVLRAERKVYAVVEGKGGFQGYFMEW